MTFETQELKPEDVGILFSYRKGLGYLAFKPETFNADQIELIDKLKVEDFEKGKSQSTRIRNILYLLWHQNNEGFIDFNLYYLNKTEKFITHLKSKLNNL